MCVCSRKNDQVARALLSLPYWITNKMLECVQSAETRLGRVPSTIEIFVEMVHKYPGLKSQVDDVYKVAAVLISLFREDWLYTDVTAQFYSLTKHKDMKSYSELFREKFGPLYGCARDGTVCPTGAKTINFNKLIEVLKSSDAKLFDDNKWMFDGDFKFLDGQKLPSKIAFNTFPRSGNSFLRKYMEQMTGISTGATVHLHTSTSLQIQGLKGEAIIDDRTWIIKAHHPMDIPLATSFKSDKVVCCIRNPLDVFVSFASLGNTLSHTGQPPYSYSKDYPAWWDWFVKLQAVQHAKYFETMLRHCNKENQNPIYIVRYEDLVDNPREQLEGIYKFLLDLDDLKGTNAERRLDQIMAMGADAAKTYQTKKTTGKFNAHRDKYTDEQIEFIKEKNADLLYYMGYTNHPEQDNTRCAFFTFNEHKEENVKKFFGFREDNQKHLKKVVQEGGWKGQKYTVNWHPDNFPVYPPEALARI